MTPRLTPQTTQKRRDAILAAAMHVTLTRGLHQCTMENIAAEAGVSVGSLYSHFSGRDEIGNAIASQILDAAATQLINAQSMSSEATPMAFVRAVDELLNANGVPPSLMLQLYAAAATDAHIRELVHTSLRRLTDTYSSALRSTAIRRGQPLDEAMTQRLARGVQSLAQIWILRRAIGENADLAEFDADMSTLAAAWGSQTSE